MLGFFRSAEAGQYLRRTSLALQLTGHALSICGQLRDEQPLLVKLAQGVVGAAVSSDLNRLLRQLHLDPDLDQGAAVAVLLAEAMDLCLRFGEYLAWPFAAWKLSSKYNPAGYIPACMDFLEMPPDKLDVGFGLQLRELADQAGATMTARCRYMLSESVQQALATAFQASSASSLPVERAFAETKRSEAPRLCHVATAGRNQILRQYLRQREEILQRGEHAAEALRRSLATNLASLAWELQPRLADRSLERESADMRAFMARNQVALKAEVARRREQATAAVAQASNSSFPVTREAWIQWFRQNEDAFYRTMQTAGEHRRSLNRRLHADENIPAPVSRLGPKIGKLDLARRPRWEQLCWGRTGWHCLQLKPTGVANLEKGGVGSVCVGCGVAESDSSQHALPHAPSVGETRAPRPSFVTKLCLGLLRLVSFGFMEVCGCCSSTPLAAGHTAWI